MLDRAIVDENLSPSLVQRLSGRGIFAQHVAHVGRAGICDDELWELALEQSAFVITHNPQDFLSLAASATIHAGLIVIREGGLTPDEQWERVMAALDYLAQHGIGDLTNQVVDVRSLVDIEVLTIPQP